MASPSAPIVPRFLATLDNDSTSNAYEAAIDDFARFLDVAPEAGARRLLRSSMAEARELVSRYRVHLVRRKRSSSTVKLRLAGLRALCSFARKAGDIDWPLETDKVRHVAYRDTRGPNMATVLKLFAKLAKDTSTIGVRNLAIVHLLFDLALRRMEPTTLDMVHVVDDRLMVAGKGRGGERIPMTMPTRTRRALKAWLRVRSKLSPSCDAIFVGEDGTRMRPRQVYEMVRQAGEAIGEKIKTHGLRHAAITLALERTNGNVRSVRHFSRHTEVSVLMRYDDNRENQGGKIAAIVARRR